MQKLEFPSMPIDLVCERNETNYCEWTKVQKRREMIFDLNEKGSDLMMITGSYYTYLCILTHSISFSLFFTISMFGKISNKKKIMNDSHKSNQKQKTRKTQMEWKQMHIFVNQTIHPTNELSNMYLFTFSWHIFFVDSFSGSIFIFWWNWFWSQQIDCC